MASNLDRFGRKQYQARGIPSVNVPAYAVDKTPGNTAARGPQLRGIAMSEGSPGEERSARIQRQAAADRQAAQENAAVRTGNTQAKTAETAARAQDDAYLLRLGQMSRGDLPEQVDARAAKRAEEEARGQQDQMQKFRDMADLARMTGEADLNKEGFRELGPEANQLLAKMTGRSNLAITKDSEAAPKLAVRLVGDPDNPRSDGSMQFFVRGKDGYQPLTSANGQPVQPMLSFVNQAVQLVDRIREAELAGTKGDKNTVDLQKEAMGNQSANARTAYEQATKTYDAVLTNNPDDKPAIAAAYRAMLDAQSKLTGAGEGYTGVPGARPAGATFMLAPDFDRQGNPYRRNPTAGVANTATTPTGWQRPPEQPQGFSPVGTAQAGAQVQVTPAREPVIPQGRAIPPSQASGAQLPAPWGAGQGLPPPSAPVELQPQQAPGWFNSGVWAPGNSSADQVLDYAIPPRPQPAPYQLPEPWGRGR